MTSSIIKRAIFWIILAVNVSTDVEARKYGNCAEVFYQIKKGIRTQRRVFKSLKVKTSMDCALFCYGEKTCKSFNYAEPSSVNVGEENCELHNETKKDDGDTLEFLKDDRYTFYQISGTSEESENTQTKETGTNQTIKPRLNGSCHDYFNSGRNASGNYTILDWQQKPRTVYCDMESEPGSVWTLIMSFTRENKDLEPFRYRAMYEDAPANEYSPNWSNYRMSLNQMTDLRNKTTHWRATCSFTQPRANIKNDYVRAVFNEFDLMGKFWGKCKHASYISIDGQSCSDCTASWWQSDTYRYTPHIAVSNICGAKVNGCCYFGAYYNYSSTFRCTANPNSTTNFWFGSYV